jgi:lysylphosphatidylglycerol synthetase-like protein (DUF2156 family)
VLTLFSYLLPNLHVYADANSCSKSFLGLETWFHYLPATAFDGSCNIKNFTVLGANSGIILIVLALLDDLLRIAALVALGYVIYGGVQYVTSQGSPDATNKALQTIINSLIGLTMAILAAAIVAFIGNRLG